MNFLNKIFKREPANISYCQNLIYLKDSNLVFNPNLQVAKDLENYMATCCSLLEVFSDKPYVSIYQEYRKHYRVYDSEPCLLFHKVLTYFDPQCQPLSDTLTTQLLEIPCLCSSDKFPIPSRIMEFLISTWNQCLGYFDSDHISLNLFQALVEHNWLKEYEVFVFRRTADSDLLFIDHSLKMIMAQTEDNQAKTCIKNIILRNFKDTFNEKAE